MNLRARLLKSRFLRFSAVGGAGFVVNEAVLHVALAAGLDRYSSWLASFAVAVTFTWWGNRTFTFHDRAASKGPLLEWATFVVANSVGAAANFAVYSLLVNFAPWPLADPHLALAVGTLVGLVFNFVASQRFVFRRKLAEPR